MRPSAQDKIDSEASRRYACNQCKRWFRNRSGLTQHTHAKHPHFSRPLAIPQPAAPDVLDNHDVEPSHIHPAFVGPDDALFRNFHPGLTG